MKHEMKRKGFTLVELLIVIVVIGILASMMMLASNEAVSSAKAATIISDLTNMKTAALAYYADNSGSTELNTNFDLEHIFPYLKRSNEADEDKSSLEKKGYGVFNYGDHDTWYAYCDLEKVTNSTSKTNMERKALLKKLGAKAESVGIVFSDAINGTGRTFKANSQRYVIMYIR